MSYPWTPERVSEAKALRDSGLSNHDIAVKLGITSDAVRCRLKRLASGVSCGSAAPAQAQRPSEVISHGQDNSHGQEKFYPLDRPLPDTGNLCRPEAPAVHTSKSRAESYLLISDAQLPYQHPGALAFCQSVRRNFDIPLENILCVGDEFDFYFASRFDKSPEAPHTAKQEIEAGRAEVSRWVAAFPRMRLCYSNHGARLRAAAHRANLPTQLIRNVREVYNLPETWQYADHWIVQASKHPFRVEHGHVGPGGHSGLRGRPLNRMMSTAWGHEHAEPAVIHIDTHGGQLWGMRTGSLLSKDPLPAFEYNAEQGSRPVGSVGVVLDGGRLPMIVRM